MWYTKYGNLGDVVLSSRIRLASNIKGIPFGNKMNEDNQEEVIKSCSNALKNLKKIDLSNMNELEKSSLLEQHLISKDMIHTDRKKAILINEDSTISVMLGEEDHIRIQCMAPGFELDECLKNANKIDDELEKEVEYGFSEKFGYLTCCPTNVGTGMRASVMLHLPGLVLSGRMEGIKTALSKLGMTARGIYGEGSKALGNIFQISNQVTLGVSEEDTIQKMKQVVVELVEKERKVSKELYENNKYELKDRIMRSYGILKNAVILTSEEAMKCLSDIRLGKNLLLLDEIDYEKINEIMYEILPATLSKNHNIMSVKERDIMRAEVIKSML